MSRMRRRQIERLVNKGWNQVTRNDYRTTPAIKALIDASLDMQPGMRDRIENMLPPESVPESFILDGLK